MAQLQNTSITGSLEFGDSGVFKNSTTEITGSAGYMWFDTIANQLKVSFCCIIPTGWSAGGNLTVCAQSRYSTGTQNAALAFGGREITPFPFSACASTATEEYNGTSWSSGGALSNGRCYIRGAGTQDAGLAFGGNYPTVACTEEYNGTSWSNGGALITRRYRGGAAGTQNAALAIGGISTSVGTTCTEEYNGTSWATGGNLPIIRRDLAGAASQNAALSIGGYESPSTKCTFEYDGSSWSSGGTLINNTTRPGAAGIQNSALTFGGDSPRQSRTEEYDGSTWSTGCQMINTRRDGSGAGDSSAALAVGGLFAADCIATEEYVQGSSNLLTGSLSIT